MEPTQKNVLELEIRINDLQIRMLAINPAKDYPAYKAVQSEYVRLCREKQQLTAPTK